MNQQELHNRILELVKEYCNTCHKQEEDLNLGDRIAYVSCGYDYEKMVIVPWNFG